MGKLILLIFLTLTVLYSAAQDTALVSAKATAIEGNITDFSVDNKGNIYLVINHQQLKKLNDKADSVAVFNDVKRYGKIHSLDVSNPLKILVYYKETSTIIVLDRFLSVKNTIDLRRSKIQQVKLVRLSYDNNIWVYDELENKIKKLDDNGKVVFESADLRNVFSDVPSFENIFDDNKNLYFYDAKMGWFVFDYYGAFIKKHGFTNWKDVQVINGTMAGRSDTAYFTAKVGDFDFKIHPLKLTTGRAKKAVLSSNHLYILHPGKLEIFPAP